MVQRRRYATREEVAGMLQAQGVDAAATNAVLDALAGLGVNLGTLVTIVTDEELDPPRGWGSDG